LSPSPVRFGKFFSAEKGKNWEKTRKARRTNTFCLHLAVFVMLTAAVRM
jgi:hypothetical protein